MIKKLIVGALAALIPAAVLPVVIYWPAGIEAPASLTTTTVANDSISYSWSSVSGATEYELEVKQEGLTDPAYDQVVAQAGTTYTLAHNWLSGHKIMARVRVSAPSVSDWTEIAAASEPTYYQNLIDNFTDWLFIVPRLETCYTDTAEAAPCREANFASAVEVGELKDLSGNGRDATNNGSDTKPQLIASSTQPWAMDFEEANDETLHLNSSLIYGPTAGLTCGFYVEWTGNTTGPVRGRAMFSDDGRQILRYQSSSQLRVNNDTYTGTAVNGSATTIELETNASATDDFYNGVVITVDGSSTGTVTDYVGATRVATVASWSAGDPSTGSSYSVPDKINTFDWATPTWSPGDDVAIIFTRDPSTDLVYAYVDAATGAADSAIEIPAPLSFAVIGNDSTGNTGPGRIYGGGCFGSYTASGGIDALMADLKLLDDDISEDFGRLPYTHTDLLRNGNKMGYLHRLEPVGNIALNTYKQPIIEIQTNGSLKGQCETDDDSMAGAVSAYGAHNDLSVRCDNSAGIVDDATLWGYQMGQLKTNKDFNAGDYNEGMAIDRHCTFSDGTLDGSIGGTREAIYPAHWIPNGTTTVTNISEYTTASHNTDLDVTDASALAGGTQVAIMWLDRDNSGDATHNSGTRGEDLYPANSEFLRISGLSGNTYSGVIRNYGGISDFSNATCARGTQGTGLADWAQLVTDNPGSVVRISTFQKGLTSGEWHMAWNYAGAGMGLPDSNDAYGHTIMAEWLDHQMYVDKNNVAYTNLSSSTLKIIRADGTAGEAMCEGSDLNWDGVTDNCEHPTDNGRNMQLEGMKSTHDELLVLNANIWLSGGMRGDWPGVLGKPQFESGWAQSTGCQNANTMMGKATTGTGGTTLITTELDFNDNAMFTNAVVGDPVINSTLGEEPYQETTVQSKTSNTEIVLAADIGIDVGDTFAVGGSAITDPPGICEMDFVNDYDTGIPEAMAHATAHATLGGSGWMHWMYRKSSHDPRTNARSEWQWSRFDLGGALMFGGSWGFHGYGAYDVHQRDEWFVNMTSGASYGDTLVGDTEANRKANTNWLGTEVSEMYLCIGVTTAQTTTPIKIYTFDSDVEGFTVTTGQASASWEANGINGGSLRISPSSQHGSGVGSFSGDRVSTSAENISFTAGEHVTTMKLKSVAYMGDTRFWWSKGSVRDEGAGNMYHDPNTVIHYVSPNAQVTATDAHPEFQVGNMNADFLVDDLAVYGVNCGVGGRELHNGFILTNLGAVAVTRMVPHGTWLAIDGKVDPVNDGAIVRTATLQPGDARLYVRPDL